MKKNINKAIFAIVCIVLIVGFYYASVNRSKQASGELSELTEVEKLITENLDKSYPKTPRAVVSLYNRIIASYYKGEYTEDQLEKLGDQARMLFDDELLANNPRDQYMENVRADIADYKARSKTIVNATVCDPDEVKEQIVDGYECAYVSCSYFVQEGKQYSRTHQMYVLRKDEDGRWKIFVFYQMNGETADE
ncbi:MAG: DUF6715 family protein [Roseburia sp.]